MAATLDDSPDGIPMRLSSEVTDVSKGGNRSKWRVEWRFAFEGSPVEHTVMLTHSVLSRKKVIQLNGKEIYHAASEVRHTAIAT